MSGRYYRRRGYYRNNGYRRSYYWRRGGSTRNKSWGNMKAAKQQADQSTFTINIPSTLGAFLKSDTLGGNVTFEHGIYAMNIYDQLRKSDFFNSYASMYDEFKIDRVKVKLLPTEFTYTATSGQKYSNVTVYTAWDRTGLNKDQVLLYTRNVTNTTEKIGNKDVSNVDGLYVTIGKDITTYSSAESRVVNPGTNTSIVRWLNPKTMQEKSQWIGTSQLAKWYDEYQVDDGTALIGRYIGIPTGYKPTGSSIQQQVSYDGDVELAGLNVRSGDEITQPSDISFDVSLSKVSTMNSENPCFLVEDASIRFKPTLLVGTYPENAANVCKFNVETEVVCTFRGLRKASVVAALYDEEHPSEDDDDDEDRWDFEPTLINENGYYNFIADEENLYYPVLDPTYDPTDPDSTYDIHVEVPPNNEFLENKLIENNGTITISSLMTTPDTKNGITKDSTLVINVPQYFPPNNYKQTLNYVGYWKWDSTNQQFIQVLNNQDIIDENYNLKIQPLFYDADTGLPQKVTVNSGNTKRLKMVNDNNDGAMEPAEYIENNTMVKFNSKTRSVTEYPYFEVEALPPTITSPITSNGYYKFDGNTLISGTNQDYNINVNISKPIISKIRFYTINHGSLITTLQLSSMTYDNKIYHYGGDVQFVIHLDTTSSSTRIGKIGVQQSTSTYTEQLSPSSTNFVLQYNISHTHGLMGSVEFLDTNNNILFQWDFDSDETNDKNRLIYMNNIFNLSYKNSRWIAN